MWINKTEELPFTGVGKVAEKSVEDIFLGLNYTERNIVEDSKGFKNKTCYVEALRTGLVEMEPNSFYSQPLGSQASPDFILNADEDTYFIEVKASKTKNGQLFNTHLIKPDFHYVISDPAVGFVVKTGDKLMTARIRMKLDDFHQSRREQTESFNKSLLEDPENKQGWTYYPRPMFSQKKVLA